MDVKIDADKYLKVLREDLKKRLAAAGIFVTNAIKEKISTGQPAERYGKKAVYYRGLAPSLPGQPPKLITGQLRGSITWEVTEELRLRVGSALPYALPLELGSRTCEPRPYIRATILEKQDGIKKILAAD